MNAVVTIPQNFGVVSSVFQGAGVPVQDDLSAGVSAGFGLIGYRGKVWSIRYRGEERQLMRDDGDGPRNSIEVVILRSSTVISKIFYAQGWVDGSNAAPDCFSTNGVTPDISAANKQCTTCAACPQNAWGSRITEAGKKGKACSDAKRLAVVPLNDLRNETFGGPMLLRVPAASLQDLANYGKQMAALGYPYFAIGTRISFDVNESYPKFVFGAIRPLSDAEAKIVVELQKDAAVERILAEGSEHAALPAPTQAQALAQAFEQPPAQAPVQVVTPQVTAGPQPVQPTTAATNAQGGGWGNAQPVAQPAQPAPRPAPQAAPAPVQQVVQAPPVQPAPVQVSTDDFEKSLEAKLNGLL